jgi:hypothetical protein
MVIINIKAGHNSMLYRYCQPCPESTDLLAGWCRIENAPASQKLFDRINGNTDRFPRPSASPHDLTLSFGLDGSELLWLWLRKVMVIGALRCCPPEQISSELLWLWLRKVMVIGALRCCPPEQISSELLWMRLRKVDPDLSPH